MALLEVRLPVHQLLLLQVRGHMCHLDIRVFRVQVFGVDLQRIHAVITDQCHVL